MPTNEIMNNICKYNEFLRWHGFSIFFKILLYKLYVIFQDDFSSDSCKSETILRVLLSVYNSLWKYYLITEIINILNLEKYVVKHYVSENIKKM